MTLGRHGVLTADGARREAALAISRIKSGQEAVEKAPGTVTMTELAARYLEEHVEVRCKGSTQKMYRSVVERFIVPAYGHVAVEDVDQQHITKLHFELRDIPYQANRALEIGMKLFNLAEEWKLRTGGNPCKFVRKYRETKRERFLTDEEFRRLGRFWTDGGGGAVAGAPGGGDPAVDADGVPAQRDRGAAVEGRGTSERGSFGCGTRRAGRGWCRCRLRRRGCWRSCRAWRAVRGSFREGSRGIV